MYVVLFAKSLIGDRPPPPPPPPLDSKGTVQNTLCPVGRTNTTHTHHTHTVMCVGIVALFDCIVSVMSYFLHPGAGSRGGHTAWLWACARVATSPCGYHHQRLTQERAGLYCAQGP